jgi:hypothetical protein
MVQIHSPRPLSLFLSSTYALALQTCSTEFVAHVAQLRPNSGPETCGTLKPFDVLGSNGRSNGLLGHVTGSVTRGVSYP